MVCRWVGAAAQAVLEGMPDPRDLRLVEVDGQVLLTVGSRVIAGWAAGDAPMRNLAAVTLRGLEFSGLRVAEVLVMKGLHFHDLRHAGNVWAAQTKVSTRDLIVDRLREC